MRIGDYVYKVDRDHSATRGSFDALKINTKTGKTEKLGFAATPEEAQDILDHQIDLDKPISQAQAVDYAKNLFKGFITNE